ncbi:intracellular septation protein [Litoreibacter halocynthiae]|uniref:Inner membrane-spanning protein YciB n=1 Tax=Litoreibacter halocynthiae TaxID=1242689 RepID=A0A4R7LGG9_9RHOB|nr:inner membrane-spanning protein YciB [Litoreibacter halocynthiae]TDT74807.1 intracellular septation protein [Litoreibacter halocynthiae]
MAEKKISQGLKSALELGPVLLFFVAYLKMKEEVYLIGGTEYSGFIVVTALFVPLLLLSMGILWKLTGKLSRMQVLTAFMVIFFGGLTVYFNDEKFFKIKTTIVYGFFASMLGIGLLLKRSWLEYVMDDFLPLKPEGWMLLTKRLTAMFAALAIANELVWRFMSTDAWVKIETFGFPIALFVFFMSQAGMLQRYSDEPEDAA